MSSSTTQLGTTATAQTQPGLSSPEPSVDFSGAKEMDDRAFGSGQQPEVQETPENIQNTRLLKDRTDENLKKEIVIPHDEMAKLGIISFETAEKCKLGEIDPEEASEIKQLEIDYMVCKLLYSISDLDGATPEDIKKFRQYFDELRGESHE